MDIKIRKRTRTVREIQREHRRETSAYLRRRRAAMRGARPTRPKGMRRPNGPGSRESIEAFLEEACLRGAPG